MKALVLLLVVALSYVQAKNAIIEQFKEVKAARDTPAKVGGFHRLDVNDDDLEDAKNYRWGNKGWNHNDNDDDHDHGHEDHDDEDDNDDCETRSFDFIVLGCGTTGSVVSYRLTRHTNIKVACVNPGSTRTFNRTKPGFAAWFTTSGSGAGPIGARQNPEHNHKYSRERSVATGGHLGGVDQYSPQGQIPCGAMCTSGGVIGTSRRAFWDEVANVTGDAGYDYEYLRQSRRAFEKVEGDIDLTNHGTTGPFSRLIYKPDDAQIAFMNATTDILGIPITNDMLDSSSPAAAAGYLPRALKDNHNANPTLRYERTNVFGDPFGVVNGVLPPSNNFKFYGNYKATKLIMEDNNPLKVKCVIVAGHNGRKTLCARKAVISALGTDDTAKFLQINGVWDCAKLAALNLPCILHNPNVGLNVWNAVAVSTTWLVKRYPHADTAGTGIYMFTPQDIALGRKAPSGQFATTVLVEAASATQSLMLGVLQLNEIQDRGTISIASDSFDKDTDKTYNAFVNFPADRNDFVFLFDTIRAAAALATSRGFPMIEQGTTATWTTPAQILLNIDSVRPTSLTAAAPTTQPFATNWHHGGSAMMGPAGDPKRVTNPRGVVYSADGTQFIEKFHVFGVPQLRRGADSHNSISNAESMGHFAYKFLMEQYYPLTALIFA